MLNDVLSGASPVATPGLEVHKRVLGVVLGETAAPISLATGNRASGAYQQAEKELISNLGKGLTWKSFNKVAFGAHGERIGDSTLYAGNTAIIISSKDENGGAPASLTGAMDTIKKFPKDFGPGTQFYDEYSDLLKLFNTLDQNTAVNGVIQACVQLDLITYNEATAFESDIYGKGKIEDSTIQQYPGLWNIYTIPRRVDKKNLKYQQGFHILSTMALLLKKELNKDLIRITNFFKAVLNKSSLVQVYTKVGASNKGIWFNEFDVIWPPTFTGNIIVETDFYTAQARPSKKLSFYFTG